MDLTGKTAIVSGAGSGLGRAVAVAYARAGARVIVADIDERRGNETVAMIGEAASGAEALFVRADSSRPEDNEDLARTAVERWGGLHIACNNAGIGGELNPLGELSVDGWRKVIEINLSGVFYAMRAQIPRMLEAGGGAIVNMASVLGQVGAAGAGGYVAAKHGVVGITQTGAIEYAKQGIRINAVGPGYIDTPLLDSLPRDAYDALIGLHPIGRLGRPEEVAELVLWLSSERASFVNGGYFPVDGAYLAQ